ncbi:HAD family hydrolase [Sphingomonas japonica]|uniref:HAD superfamily hydrolase (TIGR01490 family) n=2 Tax=Sphingomonas japonica TaxID=511662 RepID=A0ABX0U182_9SPHN|nr:HAD-IB family phosphatase [Sphingomonas japonica]NIJ23434.1 HAD superfamily hydrolase (TIGR01490 family) [Sphingomonas japonica]
MKHRIAFYDLDKTITRAPTWTRFLVTAAWHGPRWRLAVLPVAALAALGFPLRLVDRARLKRLTHRLVIGPAVAPPHMAALASRFAARTLSHNLRRGALARIDADRAAGYRLVLATASFDFYVGAIAEALRFDDVVATAGRRSDDGDHAPGCDGDNCYGLAKLATVEAWMQRAGIARDAATVRFYSDHVSDAPTLGWADEAFAVNAHAPLRALARRRGWTLLDWRR